MIDYKQKAFFFDRDGIVNRRIVGGYVIEYSEFHFIPEFFEIFSFIKQKSYLAILVTNQQGIGKKLMNVEQLEDIHSKMQDELQQNTNYNFDKIYFAPQLADSNSFMRKPNPGMFLKAIEEFNIDARNSWTIGDSINDVKAGKMVQTNTILIGDFDSVKEADYIFKNLSDSLNFIRKVVL